MLAIFCNFKVNKLLLRTLHLGPVHADVGPVVLIVVGVTSGPGLELGHVHILGIVGDNRGTGTPAQKLHKLLKLKKK